MTTSPKVFISYSHDSDEHKEWVYKIACKLIESGVETLWSVPLPMDR
ncbi:SEFIR domain-containing protein, partial [Chromobacterium sp. F49]